MSAKKKDPGYQPAPRYEVRRWLDKTVQYIGVVDTDQQPAREGYVVEKFEIPVGSTEKEQAVLQRRCEAIAGKLNAPLLWDRARQP